MKLSAQRVLIVLAAAVIATAVVLLILIRNLHKVSAATIVSQRGTPLLVAQSVRIEQWDKDSQAIVRAQQLVLCRARSWNADHDPSPSTILVYSNNVFVQTYSQMALSGEVASGQRTTFAIGEHADVECIFVDSNGTVEKRRTYSVPFIQFRLDCQ